MSVDNEDCDIGLLDEFLRAEEDEEGTPHMQASAVEAESPNARSTGATPSSAHSSPTSTATPNIAQSSPASTATLPSVNAVAEKSTPMTESFLLMPGLEKSTKKKLFSKEFMKERASSLMHKGDTDSSDDEDNRYFEEQKYSNYGRTVKHLLNKSTDAPATTGVKLCESSGAAWRKPQPPVNTSPKYLSGQVRTGVKSSPSIADINEDPIFGIRMVKPLISSMSLKERMVGRQVVPLANLKRHLLRNDHSSDWVIGGVIVSKSGTKTSQKGAEYVIWRISDLKAGLKTASVFLFGKCFKDHWKTSVGTVVGILNPKPLDNRDGSGDEAAVSVEHPQKVMIMGTSKDFGMCKARKKNGDNCTSFVNMNVCEYCVYHLQKAYKNCSRRMELQSPCAGRGLNKLRNKVLGKNEVFYAGQSFMAVPAKKSHKLVSRDNERLKKLSDFYKSDVTCTSGHSSGNKENKTQTKYISTLLETSSNQLKKDQERLRKLSGAAPMQNCSANGNSNIQTTETEKVQTKLVVQTSSKSPNQSTALAIEVPQLGRGVAESGIIELTPPRIVHRERAKLNALKWIHKHGPIRKEDPNKIPGTEKNRSKTKREDNADVSAPKHIKLATCHASSTVEAGQSTEPPPAKTGVSSRFQMLLEVTSRHMELIEARDNEAQEEYFDKLEKKEKLEDKMMSTYKVPCKAVTCLKCKYTAFSASEVCKTEGHPLKVTDGTKRFFRCCNCGNRTVSLELIPLWSCKNCASSHWERAPMMKEKKTGIAATLSIRGDEEMIIGSLQGDGNLNLLVPE